MRSMLLLMLLLILPGCRQPAPSDAKKDPADAAVVPMDIPKVRSPSQPVDPEKDGVGDQARF